MRNRRGQGAILFVLITGLVLAMLVYLGASKMVYFRREVQRLDNSQIAQSVLSSVALKVQQIYANESSCDPEVLDLRLSRLDEVSDGDVAAAGIALAVASPTIEALAERNNRCAGIGCRQFLVPLEDKGYLVTAGGVGAGSPVGGTECPRDGTIRLSVTIAGTVYYRRVTLINTCTYTSCGTFANQSFQGVTADVNTRPQTDACGDLPVTYWGALVRTTATVDVDDLRWARRYLSTGGGDVGDTTYTNATISAGNGSCAANTGTPVLCRTRNCIPAFDLNLDRTNNEADLAILEYYLRGYIPVLPVRDFLE